MTQFRHLYKREVLIGLLMAMSGVIAYVAYHYFNWPDGSWSVITVAAIIRTDLSKILLIMILRLLGTIIGVAAALMTLFFVSDKEYTLVLFLMFFISILISLILNRYRYMMMITGLTYTLIISSELTTELYTTAFYRSYEVIFGCLVCGILSLIFKALFPILKTEFEAFSLSINFKKQSIVEAFLMSVACLTTFITWRYFQYPLGFWATISCLFVLEENIGVTSRKCLSRFIAHSIMLIIASFVSFIIPAQSYWILLPLSICFFGFGYLSALHNQYFSSMANSMAVALSVVLLTDYPGLSRDQIILMRFFNVLYGIGVAFSIMALYEVISRQYQYRRHEMKQ